MTSKKKTAIYVRDTFNGPSPYYRLLQYKAGFGSANYKVFSYTPKYLIKVYSKIPRRAKWFIFIFKGILYLSGSIRYLVFILFDITFYRSNQIIVIRTIFPRKIPFWGVSLLKIYLKPRNVYWDFDDNIIFDKELSVSENFLLQSNSISISVPSDYLKNTIRDTFRTKVKIIPTSDLEFRSKNIKELINFRKTEYENSVALCWVGTKVNLCFLEKIIPQIENAAKVCIDTHTKYLTLYVVSNDKLNYQTEYLKIKNINWSYSNAARIIQDSHIGLMPLADNDYTKGKAGFKAVQYISAGLPSIVSNVGYNNFVIEDGINGILIENTNTWSGAISILATNKSMWEEMSFNARRIWEDKFDNQQIINYWRNIIS